MLESLMMAGIILAFIASTIYIIHVTRVQEKSHRMTPEERASGKRRKTVEGLVTNESEIHRVLELTAHGEMVTEAVEIDCGDRSEFMTRECFKSEVGKKFRPGTKVLVHYKSIRLFGVLYWMPLYFRRAKGNNQTQTDA
ncbi:MAG: hypothetical protein ABIH21_02800 [Patescibacteria group bacterium]